jgi:energy-coupling factor transporter ATP-binding protein EcfA2
MHKRVYPHLSEGKVEGRVIFDGQEIMALSPEERSTNIGTVFQDFESQITQVTVEDELAFGPENLALPREEIIARVKRWRRGSA